MTPKSRLFQAGFTTTLLRSAALAIALIVPASPAHAEVVTLVCQNSDGGDSMTIRVDYDRKIVDLLRSDGTARHSAAATITEGAVSWYNEDTPPDSNREFHFMGSLNRLTGQGSMTYLKDYNNTGKYSSLSLSGPCRRATQKF